MLLSTQQQGSKLCCPRKRLRFCQRGISLGVEQLETDPRQQEILISEVGQDVRGRSTPGV